MTTAIILLLIALATLIGVARHIVGGFIRRREDAAMFRYRVAKRKEFEASEAAWAKLAWEQHEGRLTSEYVAKNWKPEDRPITF